ncbi:hypothetical protein VN24_13990 [Paenibacillus beijingensis]|uniref:Beta-lactamase-related domain-containing protein n=1 Tax=Paenibacillus beijingensis TaxID=1126833 RepID=A0A0D5NQZ0_9BACL|nr:hypothetical protein VN24_13990 [Paenibacillus beijingensis]
MYRMWEPIREAVAGGLIPGASAAVLWRGSRLRYAAGLAVDTPDLTVPVQLDTIYDCASLTKVAVTLPLILMLAGEGKLGLDDPVAVYFPEFDTADKREMTIRQLLAHTSGFQASADFHTKPWTIRGIVSHLASQPLVYKPGAGCIYSDMGYILLGELAAKITGMPLDAAARQLLFEPLGMGESGYSPPEALRERIAATEYSAEIGGWWRGIVHDENARAMGGVSGHAGLFSTASDLLRYAALWLDGTERQGRMPDPPETLPAGLQGRMPDPPETLPAGLQGRMPDPPETLPAGLQEHLPDQAEALPAGRPVQLLPGRMIDEALQTQTPPLPEVNRGLGWVLKGDRADITGTLSTPRSFGHTGFTGTSLMIDPGRELAVVLLTGRVHYGRDRNIGKLRRDLHDAVTEALMTEEARQLLRN